MQRSEYPPKPSLPKEAPWKEMEQALALLKSGIVKLDNTVKLVLGIPVTGPGGMSDTPVIRTGEVVLRDTILAGQGVYLELPSPYTGRMTSVIRHWPAGCNGLVDVAVGRENTWVLPYLTDTYVALDDVTPVLPVSEPVTKGEKIWMRVQNRDALNPHTISVTVVIEGVE